MHALSFREVWCCDFEFSAPDGERPAVRCLVALEYHTRRTIRLWLDGAPVPPRPPSMRMGVKPHQAFFLAAQTDHAAGLVPVPGRVPALFPSLRPHAVRLAVWQG